jgi:hypothetical protein
MNIKILKIIVDGSFVDLYTNIEGYERFTKYPLPLVCATYNMTLNIL